MYCRGERELRKMLRTRGDTNKWIQTVQYCIIIMIVFISNLEQLRHCMLCRFDEECKHTNSTYA